MYKTILLPVAFDENINIDNPLAVAHALGDTGATVHLLHVFETLPGYAAQYVTPDLMQATRQGVLDKLTELAGPSGQAHVVEGSPGRAITDWAQAQDVDLIVMPSHQPGIGDLLWGSTAAWVVRHSKCAVHVLR